VRAELYASNITQQKGAWEAAYRWFITVPETVSSPAKPSGSTSGITGSSMSFSTSGGASNAGHAIEYQFDWGDGTSSFQAAASRTKTWSSPGSYSVKARARCAQHTSVISDWSDDGLNVQIERPKAGNIDGAQPSSFTGQAKTVTIS